MDLVYTGKIQPAVQALPVQGKPATYPYGRMRPYAKYIDPEYDLVFYNRRGGRLYVGPCEAMKRTLSRIEIAGMPRVHLKLRSMDFSRPGGVPDVMPTALGPSFIDLRDIPQGSTVVETFMIPKQALQAYARQLARQLLEGRWIFISCQLGQNRSAMMAIAVVVTYVRWYTGHTEYTATQALKDMQATRPQLKPSDWVMWGFQDIGFDPKPYGPMKPYAKHIDSEYDLVFYNRRGGRLYVGPCEAMSRTLRRIKAARLPTDYLKLRYVDFRKASNVPDVMLEGQGPSFLDLRGVPERPEVVKTFMVPKKALRAYATQLANQLVEGRWIFINCQLGQNRSAMMAIAVLVTYVRQHGNDAEYTATQALKDMRATRPQLKPQDWVMWGFQRIGFVPKPTSTGRPRRKVAAYSETTEKMYSN